jgi:hypothetical protein
MGLVSLLPPFPPDFSSLLTQYYDPLIDHNHRIPAAGGLGLSFQLAGQKRTEAQRLFEAAAADWGWTNHAPVRNGPIDPRTAQPILRAIIVGMTLAKEFGNETIYAKLKTHAEAHFEPTWNAGTGEFTWGFGLNEPHPRGQYNAAMATAEANSEGGWWRIFNDPTLRKFTDPTVYGVNFPTVCLSQAWYDVERKHLIVATDTGIPSAVGQPTSFRVRNVHPESCRVIVDGQLHENWRVVEGELEINTIVGEHTFIIAR